MPFRKVQPFISAPCGVVNFDKSVFIDEDDKVKTIIHNPYDVIPDNGETDLKRLLKSGANIQEVSTNLFGGDMGLSAPVRDFGGNDNDEE